MKSFIYTYHEKVKSNGIEKTVNVYRIYRVYDCVNDCWGEVHLRFS